MSEWSVDELAAAPLALRRQASAPISESASLLHRRERPRVVLVGMESWRGCGGSARRADEKPSAGKRSSRSKPRRNLCSRSRSRSRSRLPKPCCSAALAALPAARGWRQKEQKQREDAAAAAPPSGAHRQLHLNGRSTTVCQALLAAASDRCEAARSWLSRNVREKAFGGEKHPRLLRIHGTSRPPSRRSARPSCC